MRIFSENEYWVDDYNYPEESKMNNGIGTLTWVNVKSAIVSVVLTAFLGILGYIAGLGDVYLIDFHNLVNIGVISAIPGLISVIKSILTDNSGRFAGAVKVAE